MTRSFRPAVSVTIAGRALSAAEAALLALRVDLGVGLAHDCVVLAFGGQSPFAGTAPGATLDLELGYDGSTAPVLSGSVVTVRQRPFGCVVEALAATAVLSTTRTGRAFLSQSVADIVKALAGEGGVATSEVEATVQLPAYHVDERRTVWDHLQDLARLAGCETSCDERGRLCFRPPAGAGGAGGGLAGAVASAASLLGIGTGPALRFGAELLAWDAAQHAAGAEAADVVAYGTGGAKWFVLVKEPDGGAPSGQTLVPAAARDRAGAQAMAKGLAAAAGRRESGARLAVVGDAAIRPGDSVSLDDLPAGGGAYRAVAVSHHLSAATGFRSVLTLEGAA